VKDIDPEVAALLDDIPRSTLPPALVNEGWGQLNMTQVERRAMSPRRAKPSAAPAPKYIENCVQCGRPVTNARKSGAWWDHAGSGECDHALGGEYISAGHVVEAEVETIKATIERLSKRKQERRDPTINKPAPRGAPCSAMRFGMGCQHQCSQTSNHFGFHECKYCRKLWG
jgi:hypothetical protein